MIFRAALFAATVMAASANSLPAESKLGKSLLSKARRLDGNDDFVWLSGYSIRFGQCHTVSQFNPEEAGAEEGSPVMAQRLATFTLCPSSDCKANCKNGAEYIVDLQEFVDAYTEHQMEAAEFACEQVRENCYCDNANDDQVCENQCFTDANLDYCIEDENENEEEFEVQQYLECGEMEMNNNNGNNGNNGYGYWIGLVCGNNGNSVHLGVFKDETCTTQASTSLFADNNYGKELPYSSDSLVSSDCIQCLEPKDENEQNENDQQDEDEVTEMCERMYEMSGKCETNFDPGSYYFYQKTDSCDYIHKELPKLERIGAGGFSWATFFAVVFAISTLGLGYYAYTLYKQSKEGKETMASSDYQNHGTMASA